MEPYQRYDWLNLLQYLIFTVWTFRKITGVGEPVGWTNYLDMFSLALVYQLARSIPRLFVCLFYKQDYAKNYSNDIHEIRWKGDTWTKKGTTILVVIRILILR